MANVFLVSDKCLPQTIAVLETRADKGVGIGVKVVADIEKNLTDKTFAALVQYPDLEGNTTDFF